MNNQFQNGIRKICKAPLICTLIIPLLIATAYGSSTFYFEYDWTFLINEKMEAKIQKTVTIHPQYSWKEYGFHLNKGMDFIAWDFSTGRSLKVVEEGIGGGRIRVKVIFDSPRYDGYKFVVSWRDPDLVRMMGDGRFQLQWGFGNTTRPIPQRVVVKLPVGYDVLEVSVPSWAKYKEGERTNVVFEGVAPANDYFSWSVIYGPSSIRITERTMTEEIAKTSTQPALTIQYYLPYAFLLIAFVAALIILAIGKRLAEVGEQKPQKFEKPGETEEKAFPRLYEAPSAERPSREDLERELRLYEGYLERLEDMRGRISEEVYNSIKAEYEERIKRLREELGS